MTSVTAPAPSAAAAATRSRSPARRRTVGPGDHPAARRRRPSADASAAQRDAGPARVRDPAAARLIGAWWRAYVAWSRHPDRIRRQLARTSTRALLASLDADPPRGAEIAIGSDLTVLGDVRLYRDRAGLEAIVRVGPARPQAQVLVLRVLATSGGLRVAALEV